MQLCFSSKYLLFRGCLDILAGKQDKILITNIFAVQKDREKKEKTKNRD